jgi:hypothetical protein
MGAQPDASGTVGEGVGVEEEVGVGEDWAQAEEDRKPTHRNIVNMNTARTRMRRGRVIDITACSARGRGRSCTRGGDPKHDLKQVNDPTEHARAERDPNGQC